MKQNFKIIYSQLINSNLHIVMHNYSSENDNSTFLFIKCPDYSYVNGTIDECANIYSF